MASRRNSKGPRPLEGLRGLGRRNFCVRGEYERLRRVQLRNTSRISAVALACAALCLAGAQAAPKKATRVPRQYTIEQFYATTSISGASFSSDEKRILFSSNQTGVFNVYSVAVTGGTPAPLTSSTTDTTFAVSFFPADDRILYTRDQGGN